MVDQYRVLRKRNSEEEAVVRGSHQLVRGERRAIMCRTKSLSLVEPITKACITKLHHFSSPISQKNGATQKCGRLFYNLEGFMLYIVREGGTGTVTDSALCVFWMSKTKRNWKGSLTRSRNPQGEDLRFPRNPGPTIQGRSFANVVKGSRSIDSRMVWQEKGPGENWQGMEYKVTSEDCAWLEGTYVGTVHSVEMVRNLQEKFYMEGYFHCRIRAMGGKLVLLDCEDKEELKDLVEMASEWLGQWFEEVQPWSPNKITQERFVWIWCQGAPLNVWGSDFFEKMGSSWGKFICLDDNTSKKGRFNIARMLISTPIMDTISVRRQIKINGSIYSLRFSKEEFTNSFFSLKHHFIPSFQSDSEENESWPIESFEGDQEIQDVGGVRQPVDEPGGANGEEDDVERCAGETNGNIQLQDPQDGDRTMDVVPDSIENFENFEFSKEGENREWTTDMAQKGGNDVADAGSKNEGGGLLGLVGQNNRMSYGEVVKKRVGSDRGPNGEDSGYIAMGQDTRKGESPLSIGRNIFSGNDVECSGQKAGERRGTFERSLGSDEGSGDDGGQKRAAGSQKRRKMRLRTCRSVYLPNGAAAGESVGDSGIQNCNRSIKRKMQRKLAKEIWELAKQLGATVDCDEEVICRIDEMEKRDSLAKAVTVKKAAGSAKKLCRRVWGTEDFDWIAKPSRGLSGGLLCIWDKKIFKKEEVLEGDHFIGVFGLWGEKGVPVYILNIYSPCDLSGKRALWEELHNLILNRKGNWCLGGDFNAVRSAGERAGCKGMSREMIDFDSFITESGLVDLPMVGRKYTWYNANGKYMSRIDRFLVSEEWLMRWCDVKQWGLERTVSDHCPILLKHERVDWGPKPFKIFDAWLQEPGCKEIIRNTWNSTTVEGWYGFKLKEKLKSVKKALKEWSRNSVTEVNRKIMEAERVIAQLDERGKNVQLSLSEIEKRRSSFLDLWKNLKLKENMWQQKSRLMWLKEGDANTKFFHRCVKGRWRKNEINSIQINGDQHKDVGEIKEKMAGYFEQLYTEDRWQRPKLDGINFRQIDEADNESLMAAFSEEEIKNAVWDCESSKSPGPDGFNFKFVKCMWEDIKSEIASFIREFQEHGRLVRGSNASFITLIPKGENPQRIEEYRPISLIGIMYKIIEKLLANRLRKVLDKVIGEQQMAFIEGRQLVDGVVIANEVIDEAKRNKKRSFLFKVDFEKAYDKVCWDFLDYMLMRMGFYNTWRMWIRECLQSNTVSVLVNGSPSRQFSVSKGLRQGDPLSPFLFLIVAEGLHGLMSSAVEKELYKGVIVGKDAVMITHLQFADDTIFFGEATENNIMVIKSIMRSFELLSGLKINLQKSQLMGINVEDSWGCKMAYRLCCKKGEFPFKYLGIPIGGSHRRLTMWQPLLESFKKKLSSWKGRQLSLGGQITLINSVLSSLPVFLMSVYLLPKGTLKAIDKIRKSFLWGGEGERKRINWVNWKKVCMPKECGGLGVRDLEHFNLSLMGKWWGRLAVKEDGLWRKVIASKYGEGRRHWMDWVRNGAGACSCWWRDVRRIDNVEGEITGWLTEGFSLKLGEGKGVSFWWDEWSRGFCLANKFPRLYLLAEGKEKECCQMGSMCNGTWKWNITWRRKLLEREEEAAKELSTEIEGVKIAPGRPDEWEWIHSKDSRYSTKTAYSLLTKVPRCPTQERVFKRVWNPNLPTKISAFNWQLLLNRLPTKSNLLKRGFGVIMGDGKCSLCQEEEEDAIHLFLKCKNVRWIWKECDRWWGINIETQEDCWKTFEHPGTWTRNTRIRKGWDCTWSVIVWSIWLMRNQRIFQNQEMDPGKLFDLVQIRSFLWFKAKKAWCYFTLSDWISNPIARLTKYCGGKS
ncbi:hypothetical protein SLEP1_g35285 [Rubroshorea leprosula]|uniref:Reverse transcriptase domain-containing protein n=1 Tax=Rubroshorea leprosula TaxID=152421 RepID=A0AAV5KMS1_9ROSI|nr:hypothetical protein SLEP1_g35285 [Rubroshorea leprosula]